MNDGISHFGNVQAAGVPVLGFLTQGDSFFVRPRTGSDANDGKSPQRALKTLAKALSIATANQNDVIYLMAEGNASGNTAGTFWTTDYQSATLNWNKDMVHLIGVNGGPMYGQRSRIAFASAYATASNLFTLSANGCLIRGVEIFAGVASALPTGCFLATGVRNKIEHCQIAGMGNAANDIAGAYDINLSGAEETVFEDCVIGIDTLARSAQINANIYTSVNAGVKATRNTFRNCEIRMWAAHATNPQFLRAPTGTIDRTLEFDDCLFLNAIGIGATSLTEAMTVVDASQVIMRGGRTGFVGAGKWNATASVLIMVNGTIAATTSGYGANVT